MDRPIRICLKNPDAIYAIRNKELREKFAERYGHENFMVEINHETGEARLLSREEN
jgi:hypothetical protein